MPMHKVNGKYPLEIKGRHVRARQRQPIPGAIYRTDDVGSRGHSMRIAMKNPKTGKWVTQSWIFLIEDVQKDRPQDVKILKRLGVYKEAKQLVMQK